MHRSVLVAVFVLLSAGPGFAQVEGLLTPYIGASMEGDLPEAGRTVGVSLGVLSRGGLGAEVDVSHGSGFDPSRFEDTGLTSLMANFLTGRPRGRVRPFGIIGLGLLRTRACVANCVRTVSRTDLAANIGGGLSIPVTALFALRGDLRYQRYVQHHRDVPRLESGPYDYWRWTVGVTYNWPIDSGH